MEEQYCKKCKILKASMNFMKVIYVVRYVKTTTKITITITKVDTMKRKEKDMKKMKNIEKTETGTKTQHYLFCL